jgi:hypothetical protein
MLQALTRGSALWLEPWDLERNPGISVDKGGEHGDGWPLTARRDIRSCRPPKIDKEEHPKRAPGVTRYRHIFSAIGTRGPRCDIRSPIAVPRHQRRTPFRATASKLDRARMGEIYPSINVSTTYFVLREVSCLVMYPQILLILQPRCWTINHRIIAGLHCAERSYYAPFRSPSRGRDTQVLLPWPTKGASKSW